MAARNDWSADAMVDDRDSVTYLVSQTKRKLAELQARRAQLRQRIQTLAKMIENLTVVSEPGPTAASAAIGKGEKPFTQQRRSAAPRAPFANVIEMANTQSPANTNLRRACRIALMETEVPESCSQVCQRISKRGSFSFGPHEDSLSMVAQELNEMADEGELVCFDTPLEKQFSYKRTDRYKDLTP
jgi:hypothetical protein